MRWVGFLQTLNEKPGSARTLRSFLGQVIKDAGFYCLPLQRAFYLDHVPAIPRKPHPYDIKDQYSKEIFAKIFGLLERHETDWVQAHFIRLLFEFGVPADRLMKAEWRHIVDGRWYPWLQNERKYWRLHFRNVDNTISALLQKLRIRGKKEFGDSPFLFPSRLSSSGHIRTFRTLWERIARECNLAIDDLGTLISLYRWSVVFLRRPPT